MHCEICHVELDPFRTALDGRFCSDEHRLLWEIQDSAMPTPPLAGAVAFLKPQARIPALATARDSAPKAVPFAATYILENRSTEPRPAAWPNQPQSTAETIGAEPFLPLPDAHPPGIVVSRWANTVKVWWRSPGDLKLLTLGLPLLAMVAMVPALPKVRVANPQEHNLRQMLGGFLESMRQQLSQRAAVEIVEDFGAGLDRWQGRNNGVANWSYDETGFVQPGPLAIYQPTAELKDYRFDFLTAIDHKGIGCVFRAANLDNYYAAKLVVVKAGPLPEVHLQRYALIAGKKTLQADIALPVPVRNDTLYRIQIDARGDDFTIMVQDVVVDSFSDARLQRGGVGLFCSKDERARVHWVEVSHQRDTLGRLCAYLAPLSASAAKNGNWN